MAQLMLRNLNGKVSWTNWESPLFSSVINATMPCFILLLPLMALKGSMIVKVMRQDMRLLKRQERKMSASERPTWLTLNGISLITK